MATYMLSIEDRVGRGVDATQRVVIVTWSNGFNKYEESYNPNAQPKSFDSNGTTFDTPFSIVHPFREVAKDITKYSEDKPQMKYHISVNNDQKALFENILEQEHRKVREEKQNQASERGYKLPNYEAMK